MPTPAAGTVGSLDYTPEERKVLARKSRSFECHTCGPVANKLAEGQGKRLGGDILTAEETSLLKQISLKGEDENRLQEKGENVVTVTARSDNCKEGGEAVETEIRQRLVPAEITEEEPVCVARQDSILQTSIQRSNR